MSDITKRALEASLKKMLLKKPVTKITISDITEDCGVNRATFYYHFKDIYGANVILARIRANKRDATKEARRSNFDVALGNNIDFSKIAREKLDTFPILLPYKLHTDLENAIKDCNRIRTSYISSGGDIDDCIHKFHLKMVEFKKLYQKAEDY